MHPEDVRLFTLRLDTQTNFMAYHQFIDLSTLPLMIEILQKSENYATELFPIFYQIQYSLENNAGWMEFWDEIEKNNHIYQAVDNKSIQDNIAQLKKHFIDTLIFSALASFHKNLLAWTPQEAKNIILKSNNYYKEYSQSSSEKESALEFKR